MKNNIKKFIDINKLIENRDKIIIAMSGGADSVSLFHILSELKDVYKLEIILAHINHNLRKTALRDEKFVKFLGEKYNIKTYVLSADIEKYAKENKIGLEEAGREVRYNYFEKLRLKEKAQKVALAHNLDDNVETFMFRLMRGSSLKGLSGIPVKRDFYIRPLLNTYKKDIINYLKERNYDFVEDESNQKDIYTRNKIRLNLIPYIEENFNLKFKDKINKLISEISDLERGKEKEIEKYYKRDKIYLREIKEKSQDEQKRIIAYYLREKKININTNKIKEVYSILDKGGLKILDLNEEYIMKKDYEALYLEKRSERVFPETVELSIGESFRFSRYKIETEILYEKELKEKNVLLISYDKLENKTISVRRRKAGDKIYLKGLKGRKKIKQLFIDMKIEKDKRDFIPVFEADNEIIAVGNLKINSNYTVDDNVEKILKITCVEV